MKIILSHRYLDFDALAAMTAAQRLYPDAVLVIEGTHGSTVQDFLALVKEHLPYKRFKEIEPASVEKIILVDTNDLSRAVSNKKVLDSLNNVEIEIIDHHPYSGIPTENMTIEPVGACTTLLVERIIRKGLRIGSFDATILALGIYDDTGSLLFENTTPRDLRAAAFLLEQGAQLGVLADYLRRPLSEEQMKLFQQLLDNGITEKFEGIPVYFSHAETNEYIGGLALLIHRIGDIENADVWFIAVKMADRVYVAGRSKGDALSVNKIVRVFGGDGHSKAASAVIKDGEVEAVLAKLRSETQSRIGRPHLVRDIMSSPVKTVSPDTTMGETADILLRYGHTGVPVVEDHKLLGIISRRDVDKALKHGLGHAPVKGFMTRDVVTVSSSESWEEVQKLMVLHDIGRIPVVDDGELVGIVSRSDVLSLIYRSVVPTTAELVRQRSAAQAEEALRRIEKLPANLQLTLEQIKRAALESGFPVYLVGGFVRDLFLNLPTTDLDIVVEGNGILFAECLSKYLDTVKLTRHKEFGTAGIVLADGTRLDIAGTRREDYDHPGALPVVEESSLKDDLFRRDFTINAMALCLNTPRFGEVIDYYGGLRDLKQGQIRFLHNLSFIDDPTRILRAIRFAGRYNFKISKITNDAVYTALEAGVLAKVSVERFTEELMLIYAEQNYRIMGQKLQETGVLKAWFQADLPWSFEQEGDTASWPLEKRWLASLKEMRSGDISVVLQRLKLNRNLQRLTLNYRQLRDKLAKTLLSLTKDDPVKLDALLSGAPPIILDVLASQDEFASAVKRYIIALAGIDMKVTGSALIQAGLKEGPQIGKVLREIRNLWLQGKIKTSAEEEAYMQNILGQIRKGENN